MVVVIRVLQGGERRRAVQPWPAAISHDTGEIRILCLSFSLSSLSLHPSLIQVSLCGSQKAKSTQLELKAVTCKEGQGGNQILDCQLYLCQNHHNHQALYAILHPQVAK